RGRLRSQDHPVGEVARVTRVPRRASFRVMQAIVVVGDVDYGARAMDRRRASPASGEGGDEIVDQALHRVRAGGGVGQITEREGATNIVGATERTHHGRPRLGEERNRSGRVAPTTESGLRALAPLGGPQIDTAARDPDWVGGPINRRAARTRITRRKLTWARASRKSRAIDLTGTARSSGRTWPRRRCADRIRCRP